ncbi:MAG: hypothetical protein HY323_01040 [Betaproteobacteria bacterium]|nr:hypothetical protein [Betaproteobacteria bacterium]
MLADIDAVVASVRGSTCSHDYPELPDWVARALQAAQSRSESALQRSRERSQAVRIGIRQAVGALPVGVNARGLAGAVQRRIVRKGPARYGLARVPDIGTIHDVLREMLREMRAEK